MRIRLHHTHIFASDFDRSLKFWKDMFGAEVLNEGIAAKSFLIGIGEGKINIYDQRPREGPGGAYHHIGIQTDDLDALMAHMKSKGFRFEGEVKDYVFLRYIMAMAPDNILLELLEVNPEKAPTDRQEALRKAFGWD